MRIVKVLFTIIFMLVFVFAVILYLFFSSRTAETFSPSGFNGFTAVIDAGHGGEDGGAVSISGAIESHINLKIALRLDQIFGLYGVDSVLLRDNDVSLHDPSAQTLRQKKVSDLRNRVAAIQEIENPIVISIHQNTYTSSRYSGAQVFYANGELSKPLAQLTQEVLRNAVDPSNHRKAVAVPESVYLMNHITCKAILVECGFLSNYEEDLLLQSDLYQTKLAAALAGAYLNYQDIIRKGETPCAS